MDNNYPIDFDPDDGSYPYPDHGPEITHFNPDDQPDSELGRVLDDLRNLLIYTDDPVVHSCVERAVRVLSGGSYD